MSQAETWTTKEILDSLAAALARLNNNERPFLLGATVDMSPVLANAISYTFNGVPYFESCARQRKALFEEASVADDARKRFARLIEKLRGRVGSASAPPLVGSSASHVAGSSDPSGVPAFKEKDVLGYVRTSNALELRYTKEALADLQRAEDARASDSERVPLDRVPLDRETADELAALRGFAHPSSANWLRMRSTALFHCLSHKAKAAVRAAKYSKRFRMLGPAQGWAVVVAYGLIVTPFGKRDLHCAREPSPFVGPKDSRQLVNFYRVVIEVMRMSHIAADPAAWPEGWKEVVRVRPVGCTEPAPLVEHATRKATEAAQEAAFLFEIFAGTTRVLHATIRRSRVVTGAGLHDALKTLSSDAVSEGTPIPSTAGGISTLTSPTATTRLGFDPHGFGDANDEREELGPDEGITDDVNEMYKNISKEVSEEHFEDRSQKLNDDDALCDEMAFDDVVPGWTASQAPPEKEEGDSVTGIIRTKAKLVVDDRREDTKYFQNPIYMEVERKIRGKAETFFPLASLVAFHARLALTTGPCVRALFPDFVHTSSHVEGKFSEARQEQAGNMPLDAYVEVRCARGEDDAGNTRPSLFDVEAERYRMSIQNANRGKLARASPRVDGSEADEGVGPTPAAGEVWKGVRSGETATLCNAKVAKTNKQCTNKAQKACIAGRCGKHKCGRNACRACGAALPERSQLTIQASTPAAPTSREGGEDRDAEGARQAGARVATGIEAAADDTNDA